MSLATAFAEPTPARHLLVRDGLDQACIGLRGMHARDGDIHRNPAQRRAFAGDPWKYASDVLGLTFSPDQDRMFDDIESGGWWLFPGTNGTGKTHALAAYALYRYDAVAALPDVQQGLQEQGCLLLLCGPGANTIKGTIYEEIMALWTRAESRGYPMPGRRSVDSVLMRVREKWCVEAFSPPRVVGQQVSQAASGRHHRNMIGLLEEFAGLRESVVRGFEGMFSGDGNQILGPLNPTEAAGPVRERCKSSRYRVRVISALVHPNVTSRATPPPIPGGAISFARIDDRVRDECIDCGAYPATMPDAQHHDFLYALAPKNTEEQGPRADGVPGHPVASVHVYRPSPLVTAQVLGEITEGIAVGQLIDPVAWDRAVARWKLRQLPQGPPQRVGFDPASEGEDDACCVPAWGESGEWLLNGYRVAQLHGPGAMAQFLEQHRGYIGLPQIGPKGPGEILADWASRTFSNSPFVSDALPSSPGDFLRSIYRRQVTMVSFASAAPAPTPGEDFAENMRASLYVRMARLVALDLVDVPDSPRLREEMLAQQIKARVARTITKPDGRQERIFSIQLIPKTPHHANASEATVKGIVGHSPDFSDACALAMFATAKRTATGHTNWI
jgi:hypothetical protein